MHHNYKLLRAAARALVETVEAFHGYPGKILTQAAIIAIVTSPSCWMGLAAAIVATR